MTLSSGLQVHIMTHEGARSGDRTVVDALVRLVRREGLAGITVTRGFEGYSQDHGARSSALADLGDDLPLTIDIVDSVGRIERVLPQIAALVDTGAITVTAVRMSAR